MSCAHFYSPLFLFSILLACGDSEKDGILTDEDCNDENAAMPNNDAYCNGTLDPLVAVGIDVYVGPTKC